MGSNGYTVDGTAGRIWPMGAVLKSGGAHFAAALEGEVCYLLLWRKGQLLARLLFPEKNRVGIVRYMEISGAGLSGIEYSYEVDGREVSDPYGTSFTGGERFGDEAHVKQVKRCRIYDGRFDWGVDENPRLSYEDCIFYRLHPRGFTKHPSSGVKERGTFAGIGRKLSYLKELGITSVELALPMEFEEVVLPDASDGNPYISEVPTGKLNYWGYGPAFLFAPKASYCYGLHKRPVKEFKQLVKDFHTNGMELLIELYVGTQLSVPALLDCLRFWVTEYHVDGFHLSGQFPAAMLAGDPVLRRTKLLADHWDLPASSAYQNNKKPRFLAESNDGFLIDMRRFLKGDENQLNAAIFRIKHNPDSHAVINYMANNNGFNLMDMVCYESKHNEANGEENRDGSEQNDTWNCGAEGVTRRLKVKKQRMQQLRNAAILLFLSQGTPLLLAGDEFGHTKQGNNNSYCQDNEISWINWNGRKAHKDIYEFIRFMIALRKNHPIFRMPGELRAMDHKACGHPDISFHGVKAWCPELAYDKRQLGVMYCGAYALGGDNDFYVIYNMHWESHTFALPNLPKPRRWHLAADTSLEDQNGYYQPGQEPELEDQKHYTMNPRTIAVLMGKGELCGDGEGKEHI